MSYAFSTSFASTGVALTNGSWSGSNFEPDGLIDSETSGTYSISFSLNGTASTDAVFRLNTSTGAVTFEVNGSDTAGGSPQSWTQSSVAYSGSASDGDTLVSGNLVSMWNPGTNLGVFTWLSSYVVSSGGGTGSEGSSYSGTLTVNGTNLEYEIPSSSSAGTYMLMSSASSTPQLYITHGSTLSSGYAPNFDQTKIWTLLSPTEDELDRISPPSIDKKVFCNFW